MACFIAQAFLLVKKKALETVVDLYEHWAFTIESIVYLLKLFLMKILLLQLNHLFIPERHILDLVKHL